MFSKLGVASRVYGAFGALIFLLCLAALAGGYGVQHLSQLFDEYRAAARQSLEINDYAQDLSAARRLGFAYRLNPSPELAQELIAMADDVATYDADGLAMFAGHPFMLEGLATAQELSLVYLAAYEDLVAAQEASDGVSRDAAVARIDDIGPQLQTVYDGLMAYAKDTQNTLGPQADADAQMSTWIVVGASAVAIILGTVVAFLMGKWLSGAIGGMTALMRRLAQGEFDLDIKGADRQHELGQMAKALQVFRSNGQAMVNADAERTRNAAIAAERAAMMERFQIAFDKVLDACVAGDFSKRVTEIFNDPEIDRVSANFNSMLDTVNAGLVEAGHVLSALARADLTHRMEGEYQGAFASLRDDTNAVAEKLSHVIIKLRSTSRGLKTATSEILAGANDLAERTTRQAAAIEETSAAIEQITTTVSGNADKAKVAFGQSQSAASIAHAGGQVMNNATNAMVRVTESSSKISNIIGMIDDIAFQTNLLALNASVEAARAGEAGKGFAVVAIEVRRLAQSAATASSEVKVLIDQSGAEVAEGSKLVSEAATKLTEIFNAVKENSMLVEEISQANQEQAAAVGEVRIAIQQMDEMTQHNAALVQQTNAAIEQTETQASDLDGIVDIFTISEGTSGKSTHLHPQAAEGGLSAKAASRVYLSEGNVVRKVGWSEF